MNVEQARNQMLDQQVRAWEVLDPRVLAVMGEIPREHFVPARYRGIAFADTPIPLAHGQFMMTPTVEGRCLQALEVKDGDRVLEVGTGSGFLAACLAGLGGQVTSIDIFPEFTDSARAALAAIDIREITLETRDGSKLPPEPRYDVIAVTGSVPLLDPGFREALDIGGRLFVVTGEAPVMEARLIIRLGADEWVEESLFETVLPPLVNAPAPDRFQW